MARRVEFESLFIICMRNVSWTVVDGGAKQVRKRQLTVQRPENRRTVQQAACNVQRATCAPHERGEAFIFLLCEQSQHQHRGSRPHHQLIIDHGDANANANGRSALEAATLLSSLPSPLHPLLPSPPSAWSAQCNSNLVFYLFLRACNHTYGNVSYTC